MKETHYKLKHRVTALFAAAVMLCSMLPGAAFAEEPTPQPTEETVQMEQQTEPSETDNGQTDESSPDPGEDVTEATPETAEEQPAEEEIPAAVVGAELYTDLPDAPIGSYIGSEGLPVATGETKIGISEWPESQLEEGGSYLTAAALDNDGLTMAAPLLDGADYAIVPIMAQVEYPANGSTLDLVLPDSVTLLDYYGAPAEDAESLLHNEYSEISAAVLGVYVQADANFTAQLVYTAPDGSTLTKTLQVAIDRNATAEYPFPDSEIAAFAERPTPAVTSGKITKVAKVNGTWLIWFNGEPAYCCTPGADGQPKNCPTYTYVNTSMVGADQYVPGDHYGNQYRIWGGLTQLSLGMQELPPVALSAEAPSLLDSCRTIYTDAQMQIIENYPDSTAAKILIGSAQTLLEGTDAYASARGYYTYIYQPGRAGWQTVAVIGPEISDDEPNPKPIVQEIYANWEAPAQTASGSFDFDYGIITNKVQLKTTEKVDGATIEIEPITQSGTIDGGTWNISPADKQSVTTAGHTNDDNFQNNGGAASASWTLHYSVSKTTDSRNGRVGPYTTQDEADAAADSARDAAIAELQGEAQRMVDNAVASAKAELANVKFRYEEVGVLYGFEMYWGSNGSNQTMRPNKDRRTEIILYGLLLIPLLFAAAALAQATEQAQGLAEITAVLSEILHTPSMLRWCASTPKFLLAVLMLYPLAVYCYMLDQADRHPGAEHGTAKWGSAHRLNIKYRNTKDSKENYILTENVRFSTDSHAHKHNLNIIVIGGSGSGKTRFYVKPNALQLIGSYLFLDPKGELTRTLGRIMETKGISVTVLDLVHFQGHYNPMAYLETDEDAIKLAFAIVNNTKPKDTPSGGDKFWDDSSVLLISALILYLMYEAPASEQNFSTLMYMILNCQVSENEMVENPLMMLFGELERRDPQHPAVLQFKSFMLGAKKTLQSILISAAANLYMFNSRKFAEMTSRDEMFLPRMGLEQRALFIVLPDNDTTFNFIATMLYTQLFDQLFRLADSTPEYNGALPVHVRLMMDEFANVALPKNFKNILAVCRSRNISCDIILQNIAQLKSLFKDDWEGIIGNCDTLLYLGGNEYGTYEYLSKILGKETERTKSQSIGKGSRGSSSDSLQTAGRELCMPDEIRRMRDDECLLLMRSEDPVIDKKYNLLHHPNVKYTPDAGGEPYVMPPDYMGDAVTITMDAVAAATAPEITEEMYEQLDYLEKHPEENYYENEENFSQYDQGD